MFVDRWADGLRRRAAPNHWSFAFGVISMAALVVLLVTGLYLMYFYDASGRTVKYAGSYAPLRGVEMSPAYASTLNLTLEVRGGLLARQAHHWSALVLPASLMLQLFSTFFTGAFRRPRRGIWLLLFATFVLALVGGWSGYALPDDSLSGTGLRIMHGIMLGIPFIGIPLSSIVFGGEFPGRIIRNLYPLHVFVVPVLMVIVVAARLRLAYIRKPAQFAGPGRHEDNLVGAPVLWTAAAQSAGMFLISAGVLAAMGGTMAISPIWLYGPANSGSASAGSQPDWYLGFLDGALRLVPPGWEFVLWGKTWTLALLVPLAVVSTFLVIIAAYPFIEERLSRDKREHQILGRPRDNPTRTGVGVAGAVFYGTLLVAGSVDVIAIQLHLNFEHLIYVLRATLLLGPIIAFVTTRAICIGLQHHDHEIELHGIETGKIVRLPSGGYVEHHRPLSEGRASSERDWPLPEER